MKTLVSSAYKIENNFSEALELFHVGKYNI